MSLQVWAWWPSIGFWENHVFTFMRFCSNGRKTTLSGRGWFWGFGVLTHSKGGFVKLSFNDWKCRRWKGWLVGLPKNPIRNVARWKSCTLALCHLFVLFAQLNVTSQLCHWLSIDYQTHGIRKASDVRSGKPFVRYELQSNVQGGVGNIWPMSINQRVAL